MDMEDVGMHVLLPHFPVFHIFFYRGDAFSRNGRPCFFYCSAGKICATSAVEFMTVLKTSSIDIDL